MKNKKGFTLVELIAVIIVLVITLFITFTVITRVIQDSKLKSASLGGEGFLQAVENYSFMHSVNSSKYPLKLEANKTYDIKDIGEYIKVKGDKPTEGTITLDANGKIKEADLLVNGYTVVCTSAIECKALLEPKVQVIISDTWEKEKEVEILVTTPQSGLADKPYSFDGGKTWTDDSTHIFTGNQKLDLVVKDSHGKEYTEFVICTNKKDGRGENCTSGKTKDIYISKSDTVKPTCELLVIGEEGQDGWYKSDVEIKLINVKDTAKDVDGKEAIGSGIKSQDLNISKITEDGSYEVKGTVVDNAGNIGICKETIGRDTVKPTVTPKVTGEAYSDGYKAGAKIEAECSDGLSKISDSSNEQTFNTGGEKTVTLTCQDKAGNTVTETKTYNIYEYSESSACGYKTCTNSACGTTTCYTSTPYSCSVACGSTTCSRTVDNYSNCWDSCVGSTYHCDSNGRNCGYDVQNGGGRCAGQCSGATTTEYYSCTSYCDSTCYRDDPYSCTASCATSACGNQTCWHK